jgi:hypothetical protein
VFTLECEVRVTVARDFVRYDHFGGRLVNRLWVGPDLGRIFGYRRRVLVAHFGAASHGAAA